MRRGQQGRMVWAHAIDDALMYFLRLTHKFRKRLKLNNLSNDNLQFAYLRVVNFTKEVCDLDEIIFFEWKLSGGWFSGENSVPHNLVWSWKSAVDEVLPITKSDSEMIDWKCTWFIFNWFNFPRNQGSVGWPVSLPCLLGCKAIW